MKFLHAETKKKRNAELLKAKKISPVQKKIVDLFNQDLSPSLIIRKLSFGKEGHEYISKEEFQHQIVAIRPFAENEGVLHAQCIWMQNVNVL